MQTSLVGIELETGGVLLKYLQTAVETNGALHLQQARYPAHSTPPPLHHHPKQDESFTIVEGALRFHIDDAERTLTVGETLEIPKGKLHYAYNPSDAPAVVLWETRPALRTAEYFVAMDLATRGHGRARPRLVDAAAILHEYRDELQLARPSPLVQRIVFGCLAPFGRAVVRDARAVQPSEPDLAPRP